MTGIRNGQWRLDRVEVLNWGTFTGHHAVDVARMGFLVTGSSGSGKSSLVDAVSAVLTPRGKLRFNAAAQDTAARGEDRSLVSYMRGAWRRSADEDTGEISSDYLRPGATFSGILLRYTDGTDNKPVLLVKLYHLRRGATTSAEVQELSLLLQQEAALTDFVEHMRNGVEHRRIQSAWPDALVTSKHSAFANRFCRLLGISGDNAVLLLHKTQSAKSLGNLDDLFRSFMLDAPKTFKLAENAVAQFSELSQAHRSVVEARRQRDHLHELEEPVRTFEAGTADAADATSLNDVIPAFKDEWKLRLARNARETAAEVLLTAEYAAKRAEGKSRDCQDAHSLTRRQVEESGGSALQQQRERIELANERLRDVQRRRADIEGRLTDVGVDFPDSVAAYEELRTASRDERSGLEAAGERAKTELIAVHDKRADAAARQRNLEADLEALHGKRSNLDRRLLDARHLVASQAGLPEASLPFAGELLQVLPEFADWSGAIERVLRPLATVMLVPATHLPAVRDAVDSVHLGARLVLEEIPARVEAPRKTDAPSSLVHRVQVADSPMAAWLHTELSRRFDYACVDSPTDLGRHERAVTRAGQVKRSRTRYEKDDRHKVDDRGNWYLGFDTESKLELLIERLKAVRAEVEDARVRIDKVESMRGAAQARAAALEQLEHLGWEEIDVDAAHARSAEQTRQLETMLAASADLRRAQDAEQEAAGRLETAQELEKERRQERAEAAAALNALDKTIAGLQEAADVEPVAAAPRTRLEELFLGHRRKMSHEVIDDIAFKVGNQLAAQEKEARTRAEAAARSFAARAQEFRQLWPAVTADLEPAVEDRAGYLEILSGLIADGLPTFESRFFDLLEQQSQQNVAQLAAEIRRAPAEVRERIDPVNRSLRRSVFDAGRYLKISVRENRGELGRQFLTDLQDIAAGSWAAPDRDAAEAKFEIMRRIMDKLASSEPADMSWRNHCLDTRLHVRFTATEVDDAGAVVNIHDSSAGLSGGQRQKLVTFCLAAALRYQLAGEDEDIPRYGTVIMDEAFDKADARFTKMAMDVFREFGFHMVLATPLKLLRTLEDYIGGMAVVTCKDFRSSSIGSVDFETDDDDVVEGDNEANETAPISKDPQGEAAPSDLEKVGTLW
ncbi:ATP-binding protein [Arthrobacter monumenti]